jgi:putative FmdB family regulatory protein
LAGPSRWDIKGAVPGPREEIKAMPTYDYQCEKCEFEFEREQRITEDPIKTCPQCKSRKAKRLLSAPSFILKGGGWYADGYGSSGAKSSADDSGSEKTPSASSTSDSADSAKSKEKTSSDSASSAKPDKASKNKAGSKAGSKAG